MIRGVQFGASAALLLLIVLPLAWELCLAPLRPGASRQTLKAAALVLPSSAAPSSAFLWRGRGWRCL